MLGPESGEYFHFSEGTRIRDAQVFVGKGASKSLNAEVVEGLSEQVGEEPDEWQHCKGIGIIDYHGEEINAKAHWFQEPSAGKYKSKIKKWEGWDMKVRWKGKTKSLVLMHDKVYTVLSVEKGWYRLVDGSGESYLYPPGNFEIMEN